jgi:aerotaxis receptor
MKINQPVTQREKPFPKGKYLVSKTDLKGIITHANAAFVEISGFAREELLGKNHNIVRHPDMPPQAFEDLWRTVKQNKPWRGVVKNRSKDGDHYWVDAFVVPLRKRGETIGYMSVRSEPSRAQVREAEALYQQLNASKAPLPGSSPWTRRISLRARLAAVMAFMGLLMIGGATVGLTGLSETNADLNATYEEQLKPSVALAQMVALLGDNRAQIMLGLQHAPDNAFAKMHDHPLAMHIEATLKNREAIEAARAAYEKRSMDAEEQALAKAFFEAREAFSREGVNAAREAFKAGDFHQANVLLLTKINPLYKEILQRGEALQNYLMRQGEKNFKESQQRFALIKALSIGGTLAGLVLVALAGLFLGRAMVRPIQQAIDSFERIAEGDLTAEIEISRGDEPGRLLAALAMMQVHLKVMLDEIREASSLIDSRCAQLDAGMNRVVQQSNQQHDRVQSTAAATEQFSQSVVEVAGSSEQAAEAAAQSRQEVNDSAASISSSMDATAKVVEAVQSSSAAIVDLERSIQKIGDITNTIKDIADQTNLLALNAAIEAARAGEQGRGFAVVADEVRKLAERTASSTADISAMVAEFQAVTRGAVGSMGQAVDEVKHGVGMMRDSVSGLDRIKVSSDSVAGMAQHIAAAAKEQAIASESVATNMEQISALIEQNTAAAQEAWELAEDLAHAAAGLRDLVGHFELIRK